MKNVDLVIIDNVQRVIIDRMAEEEGTGKDDVYHKARIQRIFVNNLRELAKKRLMAVVLMNNAAAVVK